MDPYSVLGISNYATMSEIKASFRRLAKESHPDLNGDTEDNNSRFRDIVEAYTILCNESRDFNSNDNNDFEANHSDFNESYKQSYDDNSYYYTNVDEATIIIEYCIREMRLKIEPIKEVASSMLRKGILWFLGGALISYFSYSSAVSNGGGTYYVMTGAILFGAYEALKGLYYYIKINNDIRNYEEQMWSQIGL